MTTSYIREAQKELKAQKALAREAEALALSEANAKAAKEEAEDYVFKSWFSRLGIGLSKTSSLLGSGIAKALTSKRLDKEALELIEENLILADVGTGAAEKLISKLKSEKFEYIDEDIVKEKMAEIIAEELEAMSVPLTINVPYLVIIGNSPRKTSSFSKISTLSEFFSSRLVYSLKFTFIGTEYVLLLILHSSSLNSGLSNLKLVYSSLQLLE